jgi:DNA-binding beta-propeller fold protein YncE
MRGSAATVRICALAAAVVLAGASAAARAADAKGGPPPPAASPLPLRPLAQVGEHLDGTPFRSPMGLSYDPAQDEVFVADSGNGLVGIFDGGGIPKFSFAPGRSRDFPVATATDVDGNIYVLSASKREVDVFDFRGEPLREITLGEVERVQPVAAGMGIGPDGRLYVLDGAGGRILVYAPDGTRVRVIRGSGKGGSRLQAPIDIAFDGAGNLYVSDRKGLPVQVYDPLGNYLRGWGKREVGADGFSTPAGISVDAEGNVYVADPVRQEVKVFDDRGNFLGRFGGFGSGPGDMAYPSDVAAGRDGRLYVLERVGRRLQVFGRNFRTNAPNGAQLHPPQQAPPQPSPGPRAPASP